MSRCRSSSLGSRRRDVPDRGQQVRTPSAQREGTRRLESVAGICLRGQGGEMSHSVCVCAWEGGSTHGICPFIRKPDTGTNRPTPNALCRETRAIDGPVQSVRGRRGGGPASPEPLGPGAAKHFQTMCLINSYDSSLYFLGVSDINSKNWANHENKTVNKITVVGGGELGIACTLAISAKVCKHSGYKYICHIATLLGSFYL